VIVDKNHYQMTTQQVDYVLDELHGYAALRDEETGIKVGVRDVPWRVTP
jgi:hypothetical protein